MRWVWLGKVGGWSLTRWVWLNKVGGINKVGVA